MPELIFTGLIPFHYPVTRDARGILLGDVEPDDIRDLDEAPDLQWRPPTADDRARTAAKEAEEEAGGEDENPGGGDFSAADETGDASPLGPPVNTPAGPVPAPPAVIP